MYFRFKWLFILVSIFLSGCQTLNPQIEELQEKNDYLTQELSNTKDKLQQLETENIELSRKVARLNNVTDVLNIEKDSLQENSTSLRSQVRKFFQNNIDELKNFLIVSDLQDYIGSEQLSRPGIEERSLMLIDLENKLPSDGILTSVGGFFVKPGSIIVKVLRPINDEFVVIWESKEIIVEKSGQQMLSFPITVNVEQNDVIGYFFPSGVNVGYDEGTGDTRFSSENLNIGTQIKPTILNGQRQRRAYSIGVFGLLN